jgi:transcriptional regulator with XRE-family HTH domain
VLLIVGSETSHAVALRREWAESLRDHLAAQGMSRKALRLRLAELGVNVTEQAIGCWLRGETSPRPSHQAVLAAVLRVPVRRLFPIEPASRVA